MGKARNIADVIDRILDVVPTEMISLRVQLDALKESAIFTAPEAMGRRWSMLADILTDALPTTSTEAWQDKVGRIVRAEE
jgi:hypothetical protein